jgi:hypothetical protein
VHYQIAYLCYWQQQPGQGYAAVPHGSPSTTPGRSDTALCGSGRLSPLTSSSPVCHKISFITTVSYYFFFLLEKEIAAQTLSTLCARNKLQIKT